MKSARIRLAIPTAASLQPAQANGYPALILWLGVNNPSEVCHRIRAPASGPRGGRSARLAPGPTPGQARSCYGSPRVSKLSLTVCW
jgi:hypothetical protein